MFPPMIAVVAALHAQTPAPAQAEVTGRWEGALDVGGAVLPVVIRVEPGETGPEIVMDSPAQSVRGLPVTEFSVAGGAVRFTVPAARGRFEGTTSADGRTWTGIWSQGPGTLPLVLTRAASSAEPAGPSRPQTPRPPLPYVAEDVAFTNEGAGVTLAGTLTLPTGSGPFPAVVLLTGSGAQDRDSTLFEHRPFAVWADALTRRGIAVLRYDDRGVGGSGGGGAGETSADFAGDAAAAVAFLRARAEIDDDRVGLMGHSEGGLIAPLAVRQGAPAAFVVMLAGQAVPGGDLVTEQAARLVEASGGSADQVADTRRIQGAVMSAVVRNKDDAEAAARAVEAVLIDAGQPAPRAQASARQVTSAWYRYFAVYDPAPALSGLEVPLLAVYGDRDLQVPADQNAAALSRLRPDAEVVVLPGLNHLLQTAETGLPTEYGAIEETVAPSALDAVADWIARTTGRP